MKPYNILLVEDDEVDIMSVERAFRKANIANRLYKAKNGLEALDYLTGENNHEKIPIPVVILLDLNMPRMNGLEFLQAMRNNPEWNTIPVVVFTTDNQSVCNAYDKYISGYMTKPVVMEQFVEKMAAFGHYWSLCEIC